MKARSKVAMKRENGTYVYDVYIKRPDKGKQKGDIRAVSAVTEKVNSPRTAMKEEDTVLKTVHGETGWKTVMKTNKDRKPEQQQQQQQQSKQPFGRLGDDLI